MNEAISIFSSNFKESEVKRVYKKINKIEKESKQVDNQYAKTVKALSKG